MKLCWLGFLILGVVFAQTQVSPRASGSAAVADQPKGKIAGTVTNTTTGEPLKKARLTLRATAAAGTSGATITATSDAMGKFVFYGLDAGSYNLSSDRAGFVRQNYGARSPNTAGTLLRIQAGQELKDLVLKMTAQGIIRGRVGDEDGDPIPGVYLQVVRLAFIQGRKQLTYGGSSQMLPDGTFVIGNLAPGTYYINANDQTVLTALPVTAGPLRPGAEEAYATTYYPSALDVSSASPIEVTPGADIPGVEIRMRRQKMYRVRGTVLDTTTNRAAENVALSLQPDDGSDPFMLRPNFVMVRGTDGAFEFSRVAPGKYVIQSNSATVGGEPTAKLQCRYQLTVSDSNLDGLVVPLTPGLEISGTFKIEGGDSSKPQAASPARPSILLNGDSNRNGTIAQVKDDGTFQLHNVSLDKYRIATYSLPADTYIKSVRFAGQEVSRTAIDLTSGTGGILDVVLSATAADISGTVRDKDGAPMSGVVVSVWDPAQTAEGLDRYRSANTDQNGGFQIRGLAPGNYRAAAWEEIDSGILQSLDFRKQFESKATEVKLQDGAHETVEVKMIAKDLIDAETAKLR